MRKLLLTLNNFFSKFLILFSLLLILLFATIDYYSGEQILIPVLYIIPISLLTWKNKLLLAYFIAVLIPAARLMYYLSWNATFSLTKILINILLKIAVMLFIVKLINIIVKQAKKLHKLESLLHICSCCKKIEDENNNYVHIEKYISEYSQTSFSHGICPECRKKLYPDLDYDD